MWAARFLDGQATDPLNATLPFLPRPFKRKRSIAPGLMRKWSGRCRRRRIRRMTICGGAA